MKQEERIEYIARRYKEGALDPETAWKRFAERHGIRRRTALRRSLWGAAAILLLLVGLSGRYWMERNASEWVTITTLPGEQKEVLLPDSTVVTMAHSSTLRYDKKQYGKEKRTVELQGKAFFQVQRRELKPFSVTTKQTVVTVLGTEFQLEETARETALHVRTGKVRFSVVEKEEAMILTAGMSATYSDKQGLRVEEETHTNVLAWKTRQLSFRQTPLAQVIRDISQAYGVHIINRTPGSSSLKLTSYYDNLTLDELLPVINETLDIRLEAQTTQ